MEPTLLEVLQPPPLGNDGRGRPLAVGRRLRRALLGLIATLWFCGGAFAQEGLGPFMPHEGGSITTAWTNPYGPDAESWIRFANVQPDAFDIHYSSSRGTVAVRRILLPDRMTARTLVLGYSAKMPLIMPNTTTLGTSAAVL